jgi:hypothetical protein
MSPAECDVIHARTGSISLLFSFILEEPLRVGQERRCRPHPPTVRVALQKQTSPMGHYSGSREQRREDRTPLNQ